MGDISIIARRFTDGHVQFGWSGNGGYFCNVGIRLLSWYRDPENVEYLFGLGQTGLIGKVGSENGGCSRLESHSLTNKPFWVTNTERRIFSELMFVDYAYFYDIDCKWYYIVPDVFVVKIPLELILRNLDEKYYEFDYIGKLKEEILDYIFNEYAEANLDFVEYLEECGYDARKILEETKGTGYYAFSTMYGKYGKVFDYFDDWIVVKANYNYTKAEEIIVHKNEEKHIETNLW